MNVLTDLWTMICSKLGILAFIYVIVLIMVLLDLWSGVRKAKQRKEYTSSEGYRRTVKKLGQYYNVIFAITVADILQMGALWHYNVANETKFPLFPFLTAFGALLVCLVEIKSICESADKKIKGNYQEAMKQLAEVLKQKDKIDMLSTLLSQMSESTDPQTEEKV